MRSSFERAQDSGWVAARVVDLRGMSVGAATRVRGAASLRASWRSSSAHQQARCWPAGSSPTTAPAGSSAPSRSSSSSAASSPPASPSKPRAAYSKNSHRDHPRDSLPVRASRAGVCRAKSGGDHGGQILTHGVGRWPMSTLGPTAGSRSDPRRRRPHPSSTRLRGRNSRIVTVPCCSQTRSSPCEPIEGRLTWKVCLFWVVIETSQQRCRVVRVRNR